MNAWKAPILGCLAALLASGPNVFAEEPDAVTGASPVGPSWRHGMYRFGGQRRGDMMMMRWGDKLGLTGQQRNDIQLIVGDYATRFRDLARLGRDTARELLETPPDDPAYDERTQLASALAASSVAELVTLLAEMRGKLYSVLTVEQRGLFEELRQSHGNHKSRDHKHPHSSGDDAGGG